MKKSKIIGLSLGFSALAAVAIATPFIVTSCSNETNSGIKATIQSGFATTAKFGTDATTAASATATNLDANNFGFADNTVTIYTGVTTVDSNNTPNQFVNLTLVNNSLSALVDADTLKKESLDSGTNAIVWGFDGNKPADWTITEASVLTNSKGFGTTATINLKATITNTKTATEGDNSGKTTTVTKELFFKITFNAGNKSTTTTK